MSANGLNNTDDGEMAECDGEKVVTMMDVLQEQQDFEDDANAVLGASDEKNCTYSKGYIKRQAIYACMTCCSDAKTDPEKRAGVCLACSLNCHENHELVELYTKRNFRCDCGNQKFNHPCQFTTDKNELNTENYYNQNFSGLYCVCSRPYPDPEAQFEDEMIQCTVCEDWLHASHLEATVPSNDQYSEMICKMCMDKNEFLHDYSDIIVNIEDREIDVTTDTTVNLSKGHDIEILTNGNTETTKGALADVEMEVHGEHKDVDVSLNDNSSLVKDSETGQEIQHNNSNMISNNLEETSNAGDAKALKSSEETNIEEGNTINKDETESYKSESETNESNTKDVSKEYDTQKPEPNNVSENNDSDIIESEKAIENFEGKVDEVKDSNTVEKIIDNLESENNVDIQEKVDTIPESADITKNDDKEETAFANEQPNSENVITKPDTKEIEGDTLERATEELSKLASDESHENKKPDTEISETNNDSTNTTSSTDNENIKYTDLQSTEQPDNKRKLEDTAEKPAKKPKLHGCIRPTSKKMFKGATFWPANFRQKLCTCSECLTMYKDLSVMFLIDPEDTVTAYETLGKERDGSSGSQYEKGLEALSSLDRVQQINALTEFNKMRDKLVDFLRSFKDRKEVVKAEDIRAFFADMKPRREPDGVYFCR